MISKTVGMPTSLPEQMPKHERPELIKLQPATSQPTTQREEPREDLSDLTPPRHKRGLFGWLGWLVWRAMWLALLGGGAYAWYTDQLVIPEFIKKLTGGGVVAWRRPPNAKCRSSRAWPGAATWNCISTAWAP